jgi:glucosylceramidase
VSRRRLGVLGAALVMAAGGLAVAGPARAAGEQVNVWLTTTNDGAGRNVTRGLQQQTPVNFTSGTGSGQVTINVNENTTYQPFEGAGASFTDSAAWLMNSSGLLSAATRNDVMTKLFSPTQGIGVSFLRNPMGASDLARFSYTYDDGAADPSLSRFSVAHDMADVVPLTKQALQLNPGTKVMGSPWSVPPWMKDNNDYKLGWVQSQYYPALAQYFVKYVQAMAQQGIPIDYVTVNNEPTCCATYPSTMWNGSGLAFFAKNNLLPALQNAGLPTKVLALDWNWDKYGDFAAPTMDDAAIRNHPNFGGMAWHGYGGDVSQQTTVHNQYPGVPAYDTEHSGGTWIVNQQNEDMLNMIDYTRNWGRAWVKWSLAMDQAHNPHNGGCDVCTGLVTVHNGDGRNGQVDYTVEYYTMGHLTKFVRQGAVRIDSNDNGSVRNVAWKNPDGSKALIAYNTTGGTQSVRVNWGGQSFTYSLPTKTSATFTRAPATPAPAARSPAWRASAWTWRVPTPPTEPRCNCTTATVPRLSSGKFREAPSRHWASAWTSPAPERPTAPRSRSTTATAQWPNSGQPATAPWSTSGPTSVSTSRGTTPRTAPDSRSGTAPAVPTRGGHSPRHDEQGGRSSGRLPTLAGLLPNGPVDPVEEVGQGDVQHDRGQLGLGEVGSGGVPDLVGDPDRAVLDPGGGLGQLQHRPLGVGEQRGLPPGDHVVQPLVALPLLLRRLDPRVDTRAAPVDLAGSQVYEPQQLRIDPAAVHHLGELLDRRDHVGVLRVLHACFHQSCSSIGYLRLPGRVIPMTEQSRGR